MSTTDMSTALVQRLTDPLDVHEAGRKAAVLSRLLRAGFPVPDGVVLPASALDRARAAAAGPPAAVVVPPETAAALEAALRRFGDTPLAVRSSGTEEDGPDRSAAGLYTTVLHVRGRDAVVAAVQECWASASAGRVSAYHGAERPPRLAVLVQPMVAAAAAGVAFTADPVTGDRRVAVVEAVRGVGESLVSGGRTPEVWRVSGGRADRRSGPEEVLDPGQATAVAALAEQVSRELGGPQDVEWAIEGRAVRLLQARPITALPAHPVEPVPPSGNVPPGYWQRDGEHAPVPDTPFNKVLFASISSASRGMCTELGLLFDGLASRDIRGWKYARVVPLGGRDPRPAPTWVAWLAFRAVPAVRRRTRRAAEALTSGVPVRLLHRWNDVWHHEMSAQIAELREIDLAALPDAGLAAHLDRVRRLLRTGVAQHFRLHGALAMTLGELALTCRELMGWDDAQTFALLAGTSERSTEPARALTALARLQGTAEFDEALATFLCTHGCRALTFEVASPNLDERPDLVRSLVADQAARAFDLDPTSAALALRRSEAAASARDLITDPADRGRFDRALDDALLAYPVREDNEYYNASAPLGLCRRAALELGRRLAARGQLDDVDDVFFLEPDEAVARLRDGAAAHEPVTRRRGERAWAFAHPGPASYGTPPPPPPLAALPPSARRSTESFLWSMERILGDPAAAGESAGLLRGVAASPGTYEGVVRVLRSEAEFDKLNPGDVLVCRATTPVWSVIFPTLGALVTDVGGTLSHPAIIAREYGVPAVVGTVHGTTTLTDGQVVAVDGDTGTVRVVG